MALFDTVAIFVDMSLKILGFYIGKKKKRKREISGNSRQIIPLWLEIVTWFSRWQSHDNHVSPISWIGGVAQPENLFSSFQFSWFD